MCWLPDDVLPGAVFDVTGFDVTTKHRRFVTPVRP
jgi:hypothetical protein